MPSRTVVNCASCKRQAAIFLLLCRRRLFRRQLARTGTPVAGTFVAVRWKVSTGDGRASPSPLCHQVDLDSQSFGSSESWHVCRCTLEVLQRTVDLVLHCCVTRPSFCSQDSGGSDCWSSSSSESWDVCHCTLEVLPTSEQLPCHSCVCGSSFCSQILVGLTASPPGTPELRKLGRMLLYTGGSPQGRRSPSPVCHQAPFLLSDSGGTDS